MFKGETLNVEEEDDPYGMNEFYDEDDRPSPHKSKSSFQHQSPTTSKSDKTPHTSTQKLDPNETDFYQDEDFEEIDKEIQNNNNNSQSRSQPSIEKEKVFHDKSVEVDKMAEKLQFIKKKIHFRLQSNPESTTEAREEEHEQAEMKQSARKPESPSKAELSKKFAKPIPAKVLKVTDTTVMKKEQPPQLSSVSSDDPNQGGGSRKKLIIIKQKNPTSTTTTRSEPPVVEKFSPRIKPVVDTTPSHEKDKDKDNNKVEREVKEKEKVSSKPSILPKEITPQKYHHHHPHPKSSPRNNNINNPSNNEEVVVSSSVVSKPPVPRQPHPQASNNHRSEVTPDTDRSHPTSDSKRRHSDQPVASSVAAAAQANHHKIHTQPQRSEQKLPPISLPSSQQRVGVSHHHPPHPNQNHSNSEEYEFEEEEDSRQQHPPPPRQQQPQPLAKPRQYQQPTTTNATNNKKYQHKNRWLSDPSHRYDEATGLFSTFETEAKWQSRRELYEAVHKMKELEKERELAFARSSASQVREERRPLFKVPKRMMHEGPISPISEHHNLNSATSPPPGNHHPQQISPRMMIADEKSLQELEELKRKMEYLSQMATTSKEKVVRNSYQIFGPPKEFKGFQPSIPTKPKDYIANIYHHRREEIQTQTQSQHNSTTDDREEDEMTPRERMMDPSLHPSAEMLPTQTNSHSNHNSSVSHQSHHSNSSHHPSNPPQPAKKPPLAANVRKLLTTNNNKKEEEEKEKEGEERSKKPNKVAIEPPPNKSQQQQPPAQKKSNKKSSPRDPLQKKPEPPASKLKKEVVIMEEQQYEKETEEIRDKQSLPPSLHNGLSFDDQDGPINPLIGQIVDFYGDSPAPSSKRRGDPEIPLLDQEMVWTLDDAFAMLEKQNQKQEEGGEGEMEEEEEENNKLAVGVGSEEEWFEEDFEKDHDDEEEVEAVITTERTATAEEVQYESDYDHDKEEEDEVPSRSQKNLHFTVSSNTKPVVNKPQRLRSPPPPSVRRTSEEMEAEEEEAEENYNNDDEEDFERIESQTSLPPPSLSNSNNKTNSNTNTTATTITGNRKSTTALSDPGYGEEDFEDDFED